MHTIYCNNYSACCTYSLILLCLGIVIFILLTLMHWRRLPQLTLWSQLSLKHWSSSSAWRQGKYSAQSEWKQRYSTVLYISFMPYGMWMYMTIFEYLIVQKKCLFMGWDDEWRIILLKVCTHTYIHVHSHTLSLTRWISDCGNLFRTYKQCWSGLIPSNPDQTVILAEHFFNCVCGLMARQLRGTVENSLQDFVSFLSLYEQGNDYQGEFHDIMFVSPPVSYQSPLHLIFFVNYWYIVCWCCMH